MNRRSVVAVIAGVLAIIVGSILVGLIGVAMTWNQGLGPRWFPILLVALAIPQSWAGGKIREMQSGRR